MVLAPSGIYATKLCDKTQVLYTNIDQTLSNKLHGPTHCKIGATCVYNGHNSTVCVMNSRVSGQCSYTISNTKFSWHYNSLILNVLEKHTNSFHYNVDLLTFIFLRYTYL